MNGCNIVVLVVQWLGVRLLIERSLVRLPAWVLSSQLGQLSLPSLWDRVPACMAGIDVGCIHLCRAAGDPIWQMTLRSCVMEYFH